MASPKLDVSGRPVELRDVDLDRFFHPRVVAVIGASDTPERPTTLNWRRIRAWAEAAGARIHPVNPNRDTVDGLVCHPSIVDVPEDVDLAVILVSDAVAALRDVVAKQAAFVVMFAAGFAEVGAEGEERQAELEELVRSHDVHLLGPNTNLNAFELFREDLPGQRIALITQSGHQGRPIFQGQEIGIALSHWAPTGNEADLESADFIRWFADQPQVGAIAGYIEGFKDGRTLQLAADHAAQRRVPIVMVKVGRTDVGRSWAKSHTGHLTGSDAVVSAALRQYGIARVEGLDELLDTSMMLARSHPPLVSPRLRRLARGQPNNEQVGVCVYSISGGTSAHMADMATAAGLHLPELTDETQQQLREWIPGYLRVSNPVDSGGHPSGDWRGPKILEALLADPNVDVLVVPITGAFAPMSDKFAADLVAAGEAGTKPVCVIWGSPAGDEDAYRKVLLGSQLPVFRTFRNCVTAIKAYADYHAFQRRWKSPFDGAPLRLGTAGRRARQMLRADGAGGGALSELRSKELLTAYGIPVTRDVLCTSAREAVSAAERLGLPVVMKIVSADLPHKSDLGLVRVGLASVSEVRRVYRELIETAAAAAPDATVDGVLVSELVGGGVETVVGVAHDELFGPVVMFGIGGVSVEVFGDVTFRVPPFDAAEARRMIGEVRGLPLLQGARGRPRADLRALADVLVRTQRLALDLADDIAELDVNPLLARSDGVIALDALAVPTATPATA